jgi:hypothetical protein
MTEDTIVPFTTIQDLNKQSKNRSILLFGAGPIAEKTARKFKKLHVAAIADNAKNLWGKMELGVEILAPNMITDLDNVYVVICTTSFAEVSSQLKGYGLKNQVDYCVSPLLNDLRIIDDLENISTSMLFTSGSPKNSNPKFGGGIYKLSVCGDEWEHQKVFSGNCYGLIKFGKNYISVDTDLGIFEFDEDFNILRSKTLPKGIRAHGVQYSENLDCFCVVGSYFDGVIILNSDFDVIDEISLSYKKTRYGTPKHHCNDCLIVGDSLYVSMFSKTGNWQNDVFDGCVMEYDLKTKSEVGPIVQNLWMPHNIQMINGSLHILNSLHGQLLTNNLQVIGEFPAFTRGLDYDGIYYFIGQSRNRNYSKNLGVSKNISIDAGIIVFDEITKASRFLQLPPKISEIHSIVLL